MLECYLQNIIIFYIFVSVQNRIIFMIDWADFKPPINDTYEFFFFIRESYRIFMYMKCFKRCEIINGFLPFLWCLFFVTIIAHVFFTVVSTLLCRVIRERTLARCRQVYFAWRWLTKRVFDQFTLILYVQHLQWFFKFSINSFVIKHFKQFDYFYHSQLKISKKKMKISKLNERIKILNWNTSI